MPEHGSYLELERCPHCSVDKPHLQSTRGYETADHTGNVCRHWVMYACGRCGGVVTAWSYKGDRLIQEMYPEPMSVEEAIPERARAYLEQAIASINAPAGAAMLAASSVDAMLKAKGLEEGSLFSRIKQAVEDNLLTEGMSQWAHEVRLEANDQRHADNGASLPTSEDARKLIEFVQALGTFLFVLPAKVQRGIAHAKSG
ncbi:DUF4145 domain-containing protein [Marinobacter sp. BGYM27]|uniref:DUF4145 domain-containing protein n=1 Tax=Marinobacter sp. BGYM27 TaxID=2975597 RepID=UPI00325FB57D